MINQEFHASERPNHHCSVGDVCKYVLDDNLKCGGSNLLVIFDSDISPTSTPNLLESQGTSKVSNIAANVSSIIQGQRFPGNYTNITARNRSENMNFKSGHSVRPEIIFPIYPQLRKFRTPPVQSSLKQITATNTKTTRSNKAKMRKITLHSVLKEPLKTKTHPTSGKPTIKRRTTSGVLWLEDRKKPPLWWLDSSNRCFLTNKRNSSPSAQKSFVITPILPPATTFSSHSEISDCILNYLCRCEKLRDSGYQRKRVDSTDTIYSQYRNQSTSISDSSTFDDSVRSWMTPNADDLQNKRESYSSFCSLSESSGSSRPTATSRRLNPSAVTICLPEWPHSSKRLHSSKSSRLSSKKERVNTLEPVNKNPGEIIYPVTEPVVKKLRTNVFSSKHNRFNSRFNGSTSTKLTDITSEIMCDSSISPISTTFPSEHLPEPNRVSVVEYYVDRVMESKAKLFADQHVYVPTEKPTDTHSKSATSKDAVIEGKGPLNTCDLKSQRSSHTTTRRQGLPSIQATVLLPPTIMSLSRSATRQVKLKPQRETHTLDKVQKRRGKRWKRMINMTSEPVNICAAHTANKIAGLTSERTEPSVKSILRDANQSDDQNNFWSTDRPRKRRHIHFVTRFAEKPTNHYANKVTDWSGNRPTDGPASRSSEQPTSRTTDGPAYQSSERPIKRTTDSLNHSSQRPINRTTDLSTSRYPERLIKRTTNRSRSRSSERPTNRTADWYANRSSKRPITRTIDRSCSRSSERPTNLTSDLSASRPMKRNVDLPLNRTSKRPTNRMTTWSTNRPFERSTNRNTAFSFNRSFDRQCNRTNDLTASRSSVRTSNRAQRIVRYINMPVDRYNSRLPNQATMNVCGPIRQNIEYTNNQFINKPVARPIVKCPTHYPTNRPIDLPVQSSDKPTGRTSDRPNNISTCRHVRRTTYRPITGTVLCTAEQPEEQSSFLSNNCPATRIADRLGDRPVDVRRNRLANRPANDLFNYKTQRPIERPYKPCFDVSSPFPQSARPFTEQTFAYTASTINSIPDRLPVTQNRRTNSQNKGKKIPVATSASRARYTMPSDSTRCTPLGGRNSRGITGFQRVNQEFKQKLKCLPTEPTMPSMVVFQGTKPVVNSKLCFPYAKTDFPHYTPSGGYCGQCGRRSHLCKCTKI